MNKKLILLCFISLLLIGCGKEKKAAENNIKNDNVQTIQITSKEGHNVEIKLDEKCLDIIEKMGFSYEKSYNEKENIKLGNCKVNGFDSAVKIVNYRVGHDLVDTAYAMEIQCETENDVIALEFDSAFSSDSIGEMRLEKISKTKK